MFQTVPLSTISSFSLYTQQWYMSYRFADSLRAGSGMEPVPSWSCSQAVWHIPQLCVQWKTPDDGQRNCPKHVEFYSKNKLEKLVLLVGSIIRICHDAARSAGRQIIRRLSKNCEKRLLDSSRLSVCPSAWNNSNRTGRIFIIFSIWAFFINLSWKFTSHYNITGITVLYMKPSVDLWQYRALFCQWELFQTKSIEKINTHIFYFHFCYVQ